MRTFLNFSSSLFNSTAHFKSQTIHSQTRSRRLLEQICCSWWRLWPRATHAPNFVTSSQDRLEIRKYLTFKPGSSQNVRFQEETGGRELSSQNGSLPFKTGELAHIVIELEPLKRELCSVLYVTSKLSYWRREKVIMFEKINEFVPAPEDSMQYINHLFITNDVSEETRKKAILLSSCGAGTYSCLKIL